MSASLARQVTRATTPRTGNGVLFPVVMASMLAAAAGLSIVMRARQRDARVKARIPGDEHSCDSSSSSEIEAIAPGDNKIVDASSDGDQALPAVAISTDGHAQPVTSSDCEAQFDEGKGLAAATLRDEIDEDLDFLPRDFSVVDNKVDNLPASEEKAPSHPAVSELNNATPHSQGETTFIPPVTPSTEHDAQITAPDVPASEKEDETVPAVDSDMRTQKANVVPLIIPIAEEASTVPATLAQPNDVPAAISATSIEKPLDPQSEPDVQVISSVEEESTIIPAAVEGNMEEKPPTISEKEEESKVVTILDEEALQLPAAVQESVDIPLDVPFSMDEAPAVLEKTEESATPACPVVLVSSDDASTPAVSEENLSIAPSAACEYDDNMSDVPPSEELAPFLPISDLQADVPTSDDTTPVVADSDETSCIIPLVLPVTEKMAPDDTVTKEHVSFAPAVEEDPSPAVSALEEDSQFIHSSISASAEEAADVLLLEEAVDSAVPALDSVDANGPVLADRDVSPVSESMVEEVVPVMEEALAPADSVVPAREEKQQLIPAVMPVSENGAAAGVFELEERTTATDPVLQEKPQCLAAVIPVSEDTDEKAGPVLEEAASSAVTVREEKPLFIAAVVPALEESDAADVSEVEERVDPLNPILQERSKCIASVVSVSEGKVEKDVPLLEEGANSIVLDPEGKQRCIPAIIPESEDAVAADIPDLKENSATLDSAPQKKPQCLAAVVPVSEGKVEKGVDVLEETTDSIVPAPEENLQVIPTVIPVPDATVAAYVAEVEEVAAPLDSSLAVVSLSEGTVEKDVLAVNDMADSVASAPKEKQRSTPATILLSENQVDADVPDLGERGAPFDPVVEEKPQCLAAVVPISEGAVEKDGPVLKETVVVPADSSPEKKSKLIPPVVPVSENKTDVVPGLDQKSVVTAAPVISTIPPHSNGSIAPNTPQQTKGPIAPTTTTTPQKKNPPSPKITPVVGTTGRSGQEHAPAGVGAAAAASQKKKKKKTTSPPIGTSASSLKKADVSPQRGTATKTTSAASVKKKPGPNMATPVAAAAAASSTVVSPVVDHDEFWV